MIELMVNKYCHNCPDFEPKVSKIPKDIDINGEVLTCASTTITCSHDIRCRNIAKTMESKIRRM